MPPTMEELLLRLEEAERRVEEAEKLKEEAETREAEVKKLKEEAETREAEAEKSKAELQQRMAPSCFLDYMRFAEEVLFRTFHIEPVLTQTSKTNTNTTTNVSGKYYPRRLRPWDFESVHASMFQTLVTTFNDRPLFPAYTDVLGVGRDISPTPHDEQDLRPFIRTAIEKPTARVVTEYLRIQRAEQEEKSKAENVRDLYRIGFQNNAFGLDLAQELVSTETPEEEPPAPKRRWSPRKNIGVPDRWCVGASRDESVTHILVGEYKAAHKLPAQKLNAVLSRPPGEDFFTQAVNVKDADLDVIDEAASTTPPAAGGKARKLTPEDVFIARVLCQAYHYMISSGLEYGYVASGDGLIFLHVLEDEPRTLHYFWSVFPVPPVLGRETEPDAEDAGTGDAEPEENAGADNAETEYSETLAAFHREPHQTALAYLTSLCMLAVQATVRPMSWIDARRFDLARWPDPYRDTVSMPRLVVLLPAPSNRDRDGGGHSGSGRSADKGSGSRSLKRKQPSPSAPSSQNPGTGKTASTRFVVELPALPYCTQACLRGLCDGTPLDNRCPNVALHRAARPHKQKQLRWAHDGHPLTAAEVRARIVAQLADNMDKDCECLEKWGYFGSCGVLFKLAVTGYGYTFVAKGVQAPHRDVLEHEADIYAALEAFQGRLIPVCLGLVDLERPLPLHSLARVPHMMLLSYAGPPLRPSTEVDWERETERTTAELEAAGMYNDDVRPANLAWNEEAGRMMQLDFDQAYLRQPRQPRQLPPTSALSKRDLEAYRDGSSECSASGIPVAKRVRDESAAL